MLFVPVVWGFLIPMSELLFNRVAQKLTDWENWRTVTPAVYAHTLSVGHSQRIQLSSPLPPPLCTLPRGVCARAVVCCVCSRACIAIS